MLFFLGIIFTPLTKKIFGRFFLDFGYPFAKTLAILFLSYSIFLLSTLKILPFTHANLFILVLLFTFFNFFVLKNKNGKKSPEGKISPKIAFPVVIFEEMLFFVSFLFWAFVRGQEPSLRGLEKFMDFGFINSIIRTKFFPPLDMWLAVDPSHPTGYPINYYYFGHLTGAVLIKLHNIKPSIGYNLILASIFALGVTQVFSLVINLVYNYLTGVKKFILDHFQLLKVMTIGVLGTFIVNLGGNLHTIYLFTKGYPNENPIPFWKILSGYNPSGYWYPNATRFIPFTIHEFPIYSYVVADLHGHVFDIPFVLLTLAVLFLFLLKNSLGVKVQNPKFSNLINSISSLLRSKGKKQNFKIKVLSLITYYQLPITVFLGFLIAVHYMTNAFDGPIYILLSAIFFFIIYRFSYGFLINMGILLLSFIIFSFPFSKNFSPFITGIGVNCSLDTLVNIGQLGPFLFEKGNCQLSPLWMLFVLWGFFWICFLLFVIVNIAKDKFPIDFLTKAIKKSRQATVYLFIYILFSFGTLLIVIPEFFYVKDIYPAHFRANTMFKLGYQAFIMMGTASVIVFFQTQFLNKFKKFAVRTVFIFFFFFVFLYPLFAIPSYYGNLDRPVDLDGASWLGTIYPEDKEIVDFLNRKVTGQPVILEAQGDSYTDFERISAYTGLPTVAGWLVHEWLWRGSSNVVSQRIPDIINLYESKDLELTKILLKKYNIQYVIVSKMEKEKYPQLNEEKFSRIGQLIFKSSNKKGAVYQINVKRY